MASFADALAVILGIVFNAVQIIVFASVIISWVNADRSNQIVQIIDTLSELIFRPFRPLCRKIPGPLDWTPFVVILVVVFLERWLIGVLRGITS